MTKISLAIPTWESEGKGAEFIEDLFRTIEIQQFKDYNVLVSDCLLYTSTSPRDPTLEPKPSSS